MDFKEATRTIKIGGDSDSLSPELLKATAECLSISALSGKARGVLPEGLWTDYLGSFVRYSYNFPASYRASLLVCKELSDLSLISVDEYAELATRLYSEKVFLCELSDMRRFDAVNQFARAGIDVEPYFPGLAERSVRYAANDKIHQLFSRSRSYDLTHIVFYLTRFGQKTIPEPEAIVSNLILTGWQAYVSNDLDLLAEVAISLFYIDARSEVRLQWLEELSLRFRESALYYAHNDYHLFLVLYWCLCLYEHCDGVVADYSVRAPEKHSEFKTLHTISSLLGREAKPVDCNKAISTLEKLECYRTLEALEDTESVEFIIKSFLPGAIFRAQTQ